MTWPFGDLQMHKYGGLLVDAPWAYSMWSPKGYEKSPEHHYTTMCDDELRALPVIDLAGRDCIIWMWAIWPRLTFACDLMRHWGFPQVTGGAWFKRTSTGKKRMGPGYVLRTVCEPFLIGRVGDVQARLTSELNALGHNGPIAPEDIGSIGIDGLAREHSRKPAEARAILERMTPRAFRAELFGREPWAGNEVWGFEPTKFAEAAE